MKFIKMKKENKNNKNKNKTIYSYLKQDLNSIHLIIQKIYKDNGNNS